MPHLTIWYTDNLKTDLDSLCRALCDKLLSLRDADGKRVYPPGGTRVMAFPAAHSAVADGKRDYPFIYLNLRIFGGRTPEVLKATGDGILEETKRVLASVIERGPIGITLQIDETPKDMPAPLLQSYEDRLNTLHPLFVG
jgi:5-carboxymethyl-2-hydroxymuconate isomerase